MMTPRHCHTMYIHTSFLIRLVRERPSALRGGFLGSSGSSSKAAAAAQCRAAAVRVAFTACPSNNATSENLCFQVTQAGTLANVLPGPRVPANGLRWKAEE